MPLESAVSIEDLDASYPLGGDSISRGDDHLRLIKSVLKIQFPGSNGNGFSTPILANETELNFVQGVTSNIQDQLDALESRIETLETDVTNLLQTLPAPTGTQLLFTNTAVPLGWTQKTDLNDYMLRIVSGTGAGTGGSSSPISFTHSHATSGHTLTANEMPSHTHRYQINGTDADWGAPANCTDMDSYMNGTWAACIGGSRIIPTIAPEATGGGAAHTHGDTQDATWTPKYIDTIIGIKD